jgi:predicted dienelactone hydrolase
MRHRYLLALCCLILAGCGEDLVLPAAAPLSADAAVIQQLHGASPGDFTVVSVDTLELGGDSGAPLAASLYYPAEGEGHPLLLFSHGNWSDRHSYDRVIKHWVSHGYVVIAANHADCCSPVQGIFNSLRYGQLGLINRRVSDLERLLAYIPDLESSIPAFAGKADLTRIAATGHSFGAFSAQQMGGASALDTDSGEYHYRPDTDISAVVALNPPGPMFDTITAESWRGMQAPTLVTTGTWDVQKGFWEDWKMHLMSWENSPGGNKFALVVEGADHYLGNLICRTEREHPPQQDALDMVLIATTAFLDTHLKSDHKARDLVESNALEQASNGFARILQR